MGELKYGRIFYVPFDEATTPAEGHVYVNRFWAVHPEKGVAFYCVDRGYYKTEEPAPQCNASEATALALEARLNRGHEIHFIPAVYAAHAVRHQRLPREDELNGRAD